MKAHLTNISRLRGNRPMITNHYAARWIVTNWAATRVFSMDGKRLISERFHTKTSTPSATHSAILCDLRFAIETATYTPEKSGIYHGD